MSLKTLLTVLNVAAVAQHALAAPVEALRRDAEVQTQTLALQPAEAPHPAAIAQQVTPQESLKLHYAAPNDTAKAVVSIPKLSHQIINAVGASAIKSVECAGGQANVVFASRAAYDKAASSWVGDFLLAVYSKSCGTGLDGEHDFLLVSSIGAKKTETLSITVSATATDVETVVAEETDIDVKLGHVSNSTLEARKEKTDSLGKHLAWNKYLNNHELAKVGQASLSCVTCGSDGAVDLTASITYNGIILKSASVGFNGKINAAAVFGLKGKGSATIPFKQQTLLTIPIEGITLGKFLTLGPSFQVAAGGKVTVSASGSLALGAKVSGDAKVQVNALKGQNVHSASFHATPFVAAQGALSAVLDVPVTASLGVGIKVGYKKLSVNKRVALADTVDVKLGGAIGQKECPKGVVVTGQLSNDVFLDLFGKHVEIATTHTGQAKKCFKPKGKAAFAVADVEDADGDADAEDDEVDLEPSGSVTLAAATATPSGTAIRQEATATAEASL